MRILVFAPYYPPHIGGVENYASELNVRLTKSGHTATVFAPRLPTSTPKEEFKDGVRIIRYPAFEPIKNYPIPRFWRRDFFVSLKKLKQERFDIIISHTRFFFSSLLALRFATSKNMPLAHIEHGSSFVQSNNPIVSIIAYLYDQLIGKNILKKANHVIAISDSVRIFVEKLTHGKVHPTVIYRGFDWQLYETIKTDDSKWLIQDTTTPRIIYIGRLVSGKGVADLIAALELIKNKSWQCLIIGDGPEYKHLQSLCEQSGISNRVRFTGALSHKEALGTLKSADIFVNPSYSEGLPTTVIEATVFKKAIIATNVGGTNEIITDTKNGFLIKPGDPIELSEKITALLDKSEAYSETIEIDKKFSWDISISQYQKILTSLSK